jgi:acyl-CoA thioesterase-2
MLTLDGLLASLSLESVGEGCYRAPNADAGGPVVFGGQMLAQSIVAATTVDPEKVVKTVHAVFVRAGSLDTPLDIMVECLHRGRAMASSSVTFAQEDRLIARAQVLLSADEPNLIHHGDPMSDVPAPGDGRARAIDDGPWEIRYVDGVDIRDPELVGPPDLDVWTRFVGAPDDRIISQALLAFATDGFLIGTAMRPHAGVGQSQAHVTLTTGVLSHTITFHEPFSAAAWLLLSQHSSHAGHGRCYGRGNVFTEHGELIASFVQDAMIRSMRGSAKL